MLDSYVLPAITHAGVRRDLARFVAGMDPRHSLAAAERLPGFDRPALIAWSREDRFFPQRHAERLAELLPQRPARVDRRRAHVLARGPAGPGGRARGERQRGSPGAMMR